MPRPSGTPIGLHLAQVAKVVNRAFDDALARAGGSLPVWLVLIALKSRQGANQRQLADAVGIQGPTLTHHLKRRCGFSAQPGLADVEKPGRFDREQEA
jgi:MarR family transcriptional regulator, transcriptional regulator for hemolysin